MTPNPINILRGDEPLEPSIAYIIQADGKRIPVKISFSPDVKQHLEDVREISAHGYARSTDPAELTWTSTDPELWKLLTGSGDEPEDPDVALSKLRSMNDNGGIGLHINRHNSKIRQMASDSFSVLEKEELMTNDAWDSALQQRMWQMYGRGEITPEDAGGKFKIPDVY